MKQLSPIQIDNFEIFWKSYPRRVGKGAARKAFLKAQLTSSFEEIMTGLQNSISYWRAQGTEPQYIPHPSTWLNQERYADELDQITFITQQQNKKKQLPVPTFKL